MTDNGACTRETEGTRGGFIKNIYSIFRKIGVNGISYMPCARLIP